MASKGKKRRGAHRKGGNRLRVSPWWFAGVGALAAVGLLAFLIATSPDSGRSPPDDASTATPDPRVGGLVPAVTLQMEAGGSDIDAYFNPTTLTAPAGEAVEIIVQNTGTLTHNVTVAGVDGEYSTSDDWVSQPELILPGEDGRLVVKIDGPGAYPFRCSLHPQQQFGELVLQ